MSKKDVYATIAGYVLKSGKIDNNGLKKVIYRGLSAELREVGDEVLQILKQAVSDEQARRKEERA